MNDEWKNKRYRYVITLRTGQVLHTDYFDSYSDLENWIKTGFAGIYTPDGFVEMPPAQIQSIQPVDEGQLSGQPVQEAKLPQSAADPIEFTPDTEDGQRPGMTVPFPGETVTVTRDEELTGQVPLPPADMATNNVPQPPADVANATEGELDIPQAPTPNEVITPTAPAQDNEGTLTIPRDDDDTPPPPPAQ